MADTVGCLHGVIGKSKNIVMGDFNCEENQQEDWNTGREESQSSKLLVIMMDNIIIMNRRGHMTQRG